jgi:hypothetical protein
VKVFLTRQALTKGIVEAEATFSPASGFIITRDGKLYFKSDWFEKYEDAVAEFERQKEDRIANLQVQADRLMDKKPVLRKERWPKQKSKRQ